MDEKAKQVDRDTGNTYANISTLVHCGIGDGMTTTHAMSTGHTCILVNFTWQLDQLIILSLTKPVQFI